jgi:TM2 domain-containing membrane protein YozV
MQKDPILASLLNLLLVGTGHIYVGQLCKGILVLALGIVFWMVSFGILNVPLVLWAMYDVYGAAKKMDRSEKTVK